MSHRRMLHVRRFRLSPNPTLCFSSLYRKAGLCLKQVFLLLIAIMSTFSSTASSSALSLKDRISSPLEAGTSLLDAHHLPPHITPALEYIAHKLSKRAIHTTLVVVRRDYQLPSVLPPIGSPGLATPVTPSSPRFGFSARPVSALKQLVRSGSLQRPIRLNVETGSRPSPTGRWPLSPTTPLSPPPMTPSTSTSNAAGPGSVSAAGGLKFVHPAGLPMRDERELTMVLQKAEKRFGVG
jgi:hypothetical protein